MVTVEKAFKVKFSTPEIGKLENFGDLECEARLLSIEFAEQPVCTSRYARMVYATIFRLIAFVMTILLNQPAADIIYKAF